jgi:hypothetical protein
LWVGLWVTLYAWLNALVVLALRGLISF